MTYLTGPSTTEFPNDPSIVLHDHDPSIIVTTTHTTNPSIATPHHHVNPSINQNNDNPLHGPSTTPNTCV